MSAPVGSGAPPTPQPVLELTTDKESVMINEDGSVSTNGDGSGKMDVVQTNGSKKLNADNKKVDSENDAETPLNDAETARKKTEEKLKLQAKELEAESIRLARKTASGKRILSAEPYNFFQSPAGTEEVQNLRTQELVIQFNSKWNTTSEDIKRMQNDIGLKRESIEAMGRKPDAKKILVSFKTNAMKRHYMNEINSKWSHKYKAWTLEDDETAVTLNDVPFKMTDESIRTVLANFGDLDPSPTLLHKCDLDYYNLTRSLIFRDLKYDIPSALKIAGYTVQPRYVGQPKTCMLCNSRDHIVNECELNVYKNKAPVKEVSIQNKPQQNPTIVERIAKSVNESVNLIKDQPGISVNSPEFREIIQKQLTRFEESSKKHEEKRLLELENQYRHRPDPRYDDNLRTNPNKRDSTQIDSPRSGGRRSKSQKSADNGGYQLPKNSVKSRIPAGEHDYYDGVKTGNKFNVLVNNDLNMSSSGEEDQYGLVVPKKFDFS